MTLSLTEIDVTGTLSAPDVTRLTSGALTGTGAFDALMATVKLHLVDEYDEGRITRDEYSAIYLGAMTAVMQNAVQFVANHAQDEKALAEIGLLRQKTVTEVAQTDDTIPVGLGFNGTTAIEGLVNLQKDIAAQDILVKEQQVLSATAEVGLTKQKVITELAQTSDTVAGLPVGDYNIAQTAVAGIVYAQKDKLTAESEFTRQKVVTEVANVNDALPADYGKNVSTTLSGLIQSQLDKTTAEVGLLEQKTITELAQTDDTLIAGLGFNGTTAVEGLIKNQLDISAQQILESEQKVLNATAEVALTKQKVVTELAQTDDDLSGLPLSYGYNNTQAAVEGIIFAQKDKLTAETEFTRQKVVTEVGNVNDVLPIGYGKNASTTVSGLLAAQKLKTAAEVDLLDQKTVSELAQTYDTVPLSEGLVQTGYPVAGVIGKQKLLFAKQTDGFDRDAEQKLAKIVSDTFIAHIAADSGFVTPTELNEAGINEVIALAKTNLGIV